MATASATASRHQGRCPRRGQAHLFEGFLTLRKECEVCHHDYSFADRHAVPAKKQDHAQRRRAAAACPHARRPDEFPAVTEFPKAAQRPIDLRLRKGFKHMPSAIGSQPCPSPSRP
jgi:hypothetical protein